MVGAKAAIDRVDSGLVDEANGLPGLFVDRDEKGFVGRFGIGAAYWGWVSPWSLVLNSWAMGMMLCWGRSAERRGHPTWWIVCPTPVGSNRF